MKLRAMVIALALLSGCKENVLVSPVGLVERAESYETTVGRIEKAVGGEDRGIDVRLVKVRVRLSALRQAFRGATSVRAGTARDAFSQFLIAYTDLFEEMRTEGLVTQAGELAKDAGEIPTPSELHTEIDRIVPERH